MGSQQGLPRAGIAVMMMGSILFAGWWTMPGVAVAAGRRLAAHTTGWQGELYANSFNTFYRSPFSAAPTGSTVRLRLVGPASLTSAVIKLIGVNANPSAIATITMQRMPRTAIQSAPGLRQTAGRAVWQGTIPAADLRQPGVMSYAFKVRRGSQVIYYANNGSGYGGVGAAYPNPFGAVNYAITVYARGFSTPTWLRHGIIYEIFPDRFYNGNHANDENPKTQAAVGTLANGQEGLVPIQFHRNWYSTPYDPNVAVNPNSPHYRQERALRGDGQWNTDFFGGDLRGIIDKLGYLQHLGVNTLYLTPIFQADTNHKYDTGNFLRIDPGFGTLKTFVDLAKAAKARGMHLILDGVFEDTGSNSLYFNKFGQYPGVGAWQEYLHPKLKSPYYHWFQWQPGSNPPYAGWWGNDTLPLTNTGSKSFQQFVYGRYNPKQPKNPAKNAVARYWLAMGASGWRLDSADNSNFSVKWWTAFRHAVKQSDPQAAIIGEDWNNPTNDNGTDWLTGTTWDSTMNYPFRDAVISFFRGTYNDGNVQNYQMGANAFSDTLMQMLQSYPPPAMYAEMNLLGSQDTERILTILEGAPDANTLTAYQQATWRPTPAQQAMGLAKLREVAAFQYGFVGVPDIYYGDEAGMIGYRDPLNRAAYPWGRVNQSLIAYFQRLGQIRKSHRVLQAGAFQPLYANGNVFVYARTIRHGRDALGHPAPNGTALIAVNNGPARTVRVPIGALLPDGAVLNAALGSSSSQARLTIQHGSATLHLARFGADMWFAAAHPS